MTKRSLFDKVYSELKEQILNQSYEKGELLPSERKLCGIYEVSRVTVRRVLAKLEEEEFIHRVAGAGNYVGPTPGARKRENEKKPLKLAYVTWGIEEHAIGEELIATTLMGLEEVCRELGHELKIYAGNSPSNSVSVSAAVRELKVDGIILQGVIDASTYLSFRELIPTVLVSNLRIDVEELSTLKGVDAVMPNDFRAVLNSYMYLRSIGHERIAYLGHGPDIKSYAYIHRYWGYMAAASQNKQSNPPVFTFNNSANITKAVEAFLQTAPRPTAILTDNDHAAIRTVNFLKDAGLSIPHEVSVIGFNDFEIARIASPALTSTRVSWKELGKMAVKKAIELISGKKSVSSITLLETELIIRESTSEYEKRT